jgi:L-arabinokinase
MGYRIIADIAGLSAIDSAGHDGQLTIHDPRWRGYLANIALDEFNLKYRHSVPERMVGHEFLSKYAGTTDCVTQVEPNREYDVLRSTLHPIEETVRAERFRTLLRQPITTHTLTEMGDLMAAAHASYSACGIGSAGTDLLVDLVRQAGPANGLYGAKITGGGSGGSVVILGRAHAGPAVDRIAQNYTAAAGRPAYVFRGSSPGAYGTPVVEVII